MLLITCPIGVQAPYFAWDNEEKMVVGSEIPAQQFALATLTVEHRAFPNIERIPWCCRELAAEK